MVISLSLSSGTSGEERSRLARKVTISSSYDRIRISISKRLFETL